VGAVVERFRVVALDLRGHGSSDWPGQYSFRLMVGDVLGVLDELGVGTVTLAGHSMDGTVAYLLAIREPDRVERLIVEDACTRFRREDTLPERPSGPLEFDWAVVPAIRGEVSVGDPVMGDGLSAITAPTLLIGGGPECHVPRDKLAAAAERISNCTLVTIPAGHQVHAGGRVEFADAVLGWLAGRSRAVDPAQPSRTASAKGQARARRPSRVTNHTCRRAASST
jgi:pimeloyl-ACP methyl ester carboxylesterase